MKRNLFILFGWCLVFMGINLWGDDAEWVARYKLSDKAISESWIEPAFDDSEWMQESAGQGPMLWKLGPMTVHQGTTELDGKILKSVQPLPERGFYAKRAVFYWEPVQTRPNPEVKFREDAGLGGFGYVQYMRTSVVADRECDAELHKGFLSFLWVNGGAVDAQSKKVHLKQGQNQVIFKFANVGPEFEPEIPYFKDGTNFLRYDCIEESSDKTYNGYYRVKIPVGIKAFILQCCNKQNPQIFLNGRELKTFASENTEDCKDGKIYTYKIVLPDEKGDGLLAFNLLHISGLYGGNCVRFLMKGSDGQLLK